jgi:hypothetical protein
MNFSQPTWIFRVIERYRITFSACSSFKAVSIQTESPKIVMAGLDPAIHGLVQALPWMPGSSPGAFQCRCVPPSVEKKTHDDVRIGAHVERKPNASGRHFSYLGHVPKGGNRFCHDPAGERPAPQRRELHLRPSK